jgi:2-polyprenyl-6-methoxyphenol hydroxylase-like FAD-dependent oxidoreductase
MEHFERMGVAGAVREQSHVLQGVVMHQHSSVARVAFRRLPGTAFPGPLMLSQADTERLLEARCDP